MHNVSYENSLIYTPDKKLIYHVYVDKVTDNSKDSITIYNDIGRAWNYRTVAIKKKAFQGNTKIKKIGFAENAVAGSDSYVPLQLAIPDSAFAGCTSLERFNLLFKTRKGGRRGLGPENFILGGDSIFAGCDSTKLQIVIASDRKQDFLDDVKLEEARNALGVPVYPVEADGFALCDAMFGILPELPEPKRTTRQGEFYAYNPHE